MIVRWEDPPLRKSEMWESVADDLNERPGEWALVAEDLSPKYAYETAAKRLRAYGCEAQVRTVAGRASVWARKPADG